MNFVKNTSLIENLKNRVSNFKNELSSIGNRVTTRLQNNISSWAQKNPQQTQNIINAPARLSQAITEPIASIPYRISQNKIDQQAKGLYNIPEKYLPMTPIYQSRQNNQLQSREPNITYIPEQYINIIPQKYPQLEAAKQRILSGQNIRPVAKQYLSQVPITYRAPRLLENPYAGLSGERNTPYREIIINPNLNMNPQQLETVIKHELLHQTPRLVPVELFHPKNKEVINKYTQAWGKQYMKNPKGLVEEMFASEDLPPAYYWHIFKSVNPKATRRNFIEHLKSYFTNNINNPTPAVAQTGGNGQPGMIVSGSGGQPVYGQSNK